MPDPRPAPARRWRGLLAPLALAVLAAAPRFVGLDTQSLWYDEGISAFQLTRDYPAIVRAAAGDTHPPLYYWLLKTWALLFGASEAGLRSLSAALGVGSVVLTWALGRRLFGPLAGVVAGALLALAPLAVYYAQEVRMYTLVVALGLLAAWAYVRGWLWLYALAAAATLYSQYLGAALLAAIHLHALAAQREGRWWGRWLLANVAAGLLFLPWLPVFLEQASGRALNTQPRTAQGIAGGTLAAYGGGLADGPLASATGAALLVLGVSGAALGARRAGRGVLLALLLWLVPLALVVALGLRSGLFELRYLLLGVPGLCLLAALGVERLAGGASALLPGWVAPRWREAVVAGVGVALLLGLAAPMGVALARQATDPALARDDYRAMVRDIERQAAPDDAIVLSAPNQVEVFTYYYRGPLAVYPLPAQRPIDEADTLARLEAIGARHPRVWLVSWALREADPRGVIEDWLARHGFAQGHRWYGTLQLVPVALGGAAAEEALDVRLEDGISLVGFAVGGWTARPGETVALRLRWQTRQTPGQRWKVFTQVLDERPQVVAQHDGEPAGGLRPTPTWRPGEVVEDNHGLVLPPDLPPGRYTLVAGLYLESGPRARLDEGGGDVVRLGSLEVRP